MKLNLLLGLALCAPAFMNAAELTVVHSTAGSFGSEMEAALTEAGLKASDVTKLVVTGDAFMTVQKNGTGAEAYWLDDFEPIRTQLSATLQEIDLSQAKFKNNIINGRDTYGQNGPLSSMTELVKAVLPETLTSIGGGCFNGCTKLESINIPSSVKTVWHYAFNKCEKLVINELPASLVQVGPYAFAECKALNVGELPQGLKEVGDNGFLKCSGLKSSVIPETLTTIKSAGFASTGVTFSEWTEKLKTIGERAFSGTKVTFKTWSPYVAKLPSGVFGYCSTLLDFTIPETITSIPQAAFYYEQSGERTFTCRNSVPPTAIDNDKEAWKNSFGPSKVYKKTTFRVKKEAVEAYQATAPYSKMNIVALTTSMPVVIEGEGSVTTELGNIKEDLLPVYEGNTVITFVPADGQAISSVRYGEEELVVENNTVTIDCPQEPAVLSVVFSTESSVESIASDDVKIAYDSNRVEIDGYDGLIELYGINGNLLVSNYGSLLDISALESGVYVVRAGNVRAKILKK